MIYDRPIHCIYSYNGCLSILKSNNVVPLKFGLRSSKVIENDATQ